MSEMDEEGFQTSFDAAVGVHPVIHQQHKATEWGGVQGEGSLESAQLYSTATMLTVLAEFQHIAPHQTQVMHSLQLSPWSKTKAHITSIQGLG